MPKNIWTRRRFLQIAAAGTQLAAIQHLPAAQLLGTQPSIPSRPSIFDHTGAEYLHIAPGNFVMGTRTKIPLTLCEPLAYMTRAELQTMFPHGDPARFTLSDVLFEDGDPDEHPAIPTAIHQPFYLAATQVTNQQYELFDPSHKNLRGKFGFSKTDDEAVLYVSWHDAVAYCAWLAQREGKPYRLPTETEWEFAAHAGTTTLFSTGNLLPDYYLKNARVTDFQSPQDKVSLRVGQTPPNPWGLCEMHGNVEEWVADSYAPRAQPTARNSGATHTAGAAHYDQFKVTRGGSHGTFAYYLRSANRSAALPETRAFTIGFRVACGDQEKSRPQISISATIPPQPLPTRSLAEIKRGPNPSEPYFSGPHQFVKIPPDAHGPLYHFHNHDTGLAECPNGDLLAIWYSCAREQGRELAIASARLPFGATEWQPAQLFWDTPDRNDHCPALWFDGDQTLYHLNGAALSHNWEPLQIILRTSTDNGLTWSNARYIAPDFGMSNMVCQPILRLRNGWWIFGADAGQNSTMWLSKDEGLTWQDTGGAINGIHASIVELTDGRIMALGRGNNVNHHLPMSITSDFGKTWHAQATTLPPITYTQRFSMKRLAEGPLALATFLPDVANLQPQQKTDRELAKLCVCLSYDDGLTWPDRRILTDVTDPAHEHGLTGMSFGRIYMGPGASEPTGYVTLTQSRNGVIHVISSMNHYAFNLAWIKSAPKNPTPMPAPKNLAAKNNLPTKLTSQQMHPYRITQNNWSNERTGALDSLNTEKGFTAQVRFHLGASPDAHFILRANIRSGCTMCNHYGLRVTPAGAAYWYAAAWQSIPNSAPPTGSDPSAADATYRLAVRDDTCIQIYRDTTLLASFPPSYEIGFAAPTRGNWFEWEINTPDAAPTVAEIAYDLTGPFAPA